jgi:YVTN family beta-propeller protein
VDSSLKRVASSRFSDELSVLLLSPDRKSLLAISAASREFIVAEAATLRVLNRNKLPSEPISIDVNSAGDVAIGLRGSPNLLFFRRGVAGRQAAVDGEPGSLRFRSDGNLLMVAKPASHSLSLLTVPNMQLMADLPLAMQPDNLCFTPDGGQLFVTGEGMDAVAIVFPYQTIEVEQTILAGRSPGVMACCSSPGFLFVASSDGSDLSILDIQTRRVVGIVGVGLRPSFIAITPDNQYALILNKGSDDMAVIRITAIRPSYQKKNGVALFTMLPVGSSPVHAAVMNRV